MSAIGSTCLAFIAFVVKIHLMRAKSAVPLAGSAEAKCMGSKTLFSGQNSFEDNLRTLKSAISYGRKLYTMSEMAYAYRQVRDSFDAEGWFKDPEEFKSDFKEHQLDNPEESLRLALESLEFLIANTPNNSLDLQVKSIPGLIDLLIKDRTFKERPLCSSILGNLMEFVISEGNLPRPLSAEFSAYFAVMMDFVENLEHYNNQQNTKKMQTPVEPLVEAFLPLDGFLRSFRSLSEVRNVRKSLRNLNLKRVAIPFPRVKII